MPQAIAERWVKCFDWAMENFGARLKRLRTERRMSQADLVRMTGINQGSLSKIEANARRCYFDQAIRLAKALDVTLDELAGRPAPVAVASPVDEKQQFLLNAGEILGMDEAIEVLKREVREARKRGVNSSSANHPQRGSGIN